MFSAQAPGSLMLFGEHAVVRGYTGVSTSINKTITTSLIPREDSCIVLKSDVFGQFDFDLSADINTKDLGVWEYSVSTIKYVQKLYPFPKGFELAISSEITPTLGLGSSAACIVSICKVLLQFLEVQSSDIKLFEVSLGALRKVKPKASGCDIAASVYNMTVAIKNDHVSKIKLDKAINLLVYYVGYKTETSLVVDSVIRSTSYNHEITGMFFSLMEKVTQQAITALKHYDSANIGRCMRLQHGLLNALGVSDNNIETLKFQLEALNGVQGAKISGSGKGDCVIAVLNKNITLSENELSSIDFEQIQVKMNYE